MSAKRTTFLRAGAVSAALHDRRTAAPKPAAAFPPQPTAAEPPAAEAEAVPAGPPAPPPPPAPSATGLGARLKRVVKSVFRPVVLPTMRRITWSVDRSETASRIAHLGAAIEALAARLRHEVRGQSKFEAETVSSLVEGTDRLAALERGVADLTRTLEAETVSPLAGATDRLTAIEAGVTEVARTVSSLVEGTDRLAALERGVADLTRTLENMQQGYEEDRAQVAALRREHAVATDLSARMLQMADDLAMVARRSLGLIVPLGDGLILARTSIGFLALDTADTATAAYLAEGHLPEQGSLDLLSGLLRPGDGFIDAGANYGIFSITGGRRVGPEGRVLAVEPNPTVVRALRTSLHLNGLAGRVRVEEVAGGRQDAVATFFVAEISGHSSLYPPSVAAESVEVRVRSLDDLTEPGSRWSVVKLDTEGAELEILRGMERLRAENPDLHVIAEFGPSHIWRAGSSVGAWMTAWREAGFTAYEIDPLRAQLTPVRETGLGEVETLNLLMAPPGSEAVQELLRPAK